LILPNAAEARFVLANVAGAGYDTLLIYYYYSHLMAFFQDNLDKLAPDVLRIRLNLKSWSELYFGQILKNGHISEPASESDYINHH